ncbi:MAG: hypothetical protein R3Y07_09540 [Eubacteriales bacterium]
MPEKLETIYPALATYLQKFHFKSSPLSSLLTDYFQEYKHQKVLNKLEESFLAQVDTLANSREYNRLPSRNEVMGRIEQKDSYLYWLDALGVEYLGAIVSLAEKQDLSVEIMIARAIYLPLPRKTRIFSTVGKEKKRKILP